ncbi:hypothetical protein L1887_25712 [Cichorium endivia]|nr:hypothetical protein L1887_25712 [Cichorium endivia]
MNGGNEVSEEKWAKHYSSNHQILLVGEGDFSFSLSLAMSFGSASNIVASSLDSYDDVIRKYKRAKKNLQKLRDFGAQLLHGVDTIKMKLHTDLTMRKFDRIVYNFPHAGFLGKESDEIVIMSHKSLVRGFFRNACSLLRPNGEVHVTHKTEHLFHHWNIEELATQCCLTLVESVEFKIEDYPGYYNKRGDGRKSDLPFPLGKCTTFKFILSSKAMKSTTSHRKRPQHNGPGSLARSLTPAMSALLEASRQAAVEDQAKKLLAEEEKKLLKVNSELEGVRGKLVDSEAKIVELERDKFDLQKKLDNTCSQLEEVNARLEEKGKEDASDVADLEWLLQIGISSIVCRLLKSADFSWENAMIQGAFVDLGYQKGCREMRDKVAPDMVDTELPGFDLDIEKNLKVAQYALAEPKLSVMDYLTGNGVTVAKLKKWCEEDLELSSSGLGTSQPSHN